MKPQRTVVIKLAWLLGMALPFPLTAAGCRKAESKVSPPRPPVVLVSEPTEEDVTDFEEFTGRSDAQISIEIRARVSGYLDKVLFKDGDEVKKDTELFEIDPRPYKASHDRSLALLSQAEAKQKRLEANYRRKSALLGRATISREEFELTADEVAEARASVGIAQADLELSKLNLDFTKVAAPISGRISRRMVDPGNLVKADETLLTTIVSLDPIFLYFDVDERTLLRIRRLIREGKVQSRTEAEVPVLAALVDEEGFPHRGTMDFSENRLDPSTGTLRVRALLPNPAPRVFSPGLFLRVRLPIGKPHKSMMIPEQSVGTDQGRKFLYVINANDEVVYRPVTVGPLRDGRRVVEKGLKAGERVVVNGLQRVRPGIKVIPKPAEEPAVADRRSPGEGDAKADPPKTEPRRPAATASGG